MEQQTVCVIFGGESSEHDVSLNSARNIINAIDTQNYKILLCYIDREGAWWLLDAWTDHPDEARSTQLAVMPGAKTFLTVPEHAVLAVDVIFPVLHGKFGEDGTIQGLAAMAHIPNVGCGVEASALCMDKDATKQIVAAANIPVVPWVSIRAQDDMKSTVKQVKVLHPHGPWFVKPSRAGSSVGVTKVKDIDMLEPAVNEAFRHDEVVLVETAVEGRELEVAVLGNVPNHKASGVGEIIPGSEFYDYEDKYSQDSMSRVVLDAKLPHALTKVIRHYALDAYRALGCKGLARIDFLLSDDLTPYLNEVNTLPGFTDISMYPKLWQQKGMEQSELIDRLITLATE